MSEENNLPGTPSGDASTGPSSEAPSPIASDEEFGQFYVDRFQPTVNWVLGQFKGASIRDRAHAESVVEDGFGELYISRTTVRSNPVHVLQGIIRNLIAGSRVREVAHFESSARTPDGRPDSRAREADSLARSREVRDIMVMAVGQLPNDLRQVWDLRNQELPWEEVGQILGTSSESARDRYQKAKQQIHDYFSQLSETAARNIDVTGKREPLYTAKGIKKSFQTLPKLIGEVMALTHFERTPPEEIVRKMNLSGPDIVQKYLELGYDNLQKRHNQPMPETLVTILAKQEEKDT